jgi:hypothetical protein
MPTLYKGYPVKKTDEEIKVALEGYMDALFESKGDFNSVILWSSFIQLGQTELQGRQVKRVTRASFIISAISILIALSSLWISNQNSTSSEVWETNQIEALNNIKTSVEEQTQIIEDELKSSNKQLKDLKLITKEKEKQFTTKPKLH